MQLREGTSIFLRSNGNLQVGMGRRSTVIEGLTPSEISYLSSLRFRSSRAESHQRARRRNIPRERMEAIEALLYSCDLMQIAPENEMRPDSRRVLRRDGSTKALARRPRVRVDIIVFGCGDPTQFLKMRPYLAALVDSLRTAGITRVDLQYFGDDMGNSSPTALNRAIGLDKPLTSDPHFTVTIFSRASDAALVRQWEETGIPLLPVVFNEDVIQVGPAIRAGSSPCFTCIDRTLRDVEPDWPEFQIQSRSQPFPALSDELMKATAMMTARLIANEVDGFGLPAGEVRYLDENFAFERYRWPVHHDCSCFTLPAELYKPARSSDSGTACEPSDSSELNTNSIDEDEAKHPQTPVKAKTSSK